MRLLCIYLVIITFFCSNLAFAQSTFSDLIFTAQIEQKEIKKNSFVVEWKSNLPCPSILKYGTNPGALEQTIELLTPNTSHKLVLENLEPSTFYYVQVVLQNEGEEIMSLPKIMATASNTVGEVKCYFLNGVDESFSNGVLPEGDDYQEVLDAMYDLINNAQNTIDVAVYNTNYYELVDALEEAVDRGVRVRFIHDSETNNNALNNVNFPKLAGNEQSENGIMHNKFMIVDAEDDENSYVVTGSMNWTFYNITEDFNNTIIIQDKTLALNYTIEFEEMWGSTGAFPDAGNAKFGNQKENNTAHSFVVGGVEFECYFSPSDNVTDEMLHVVQDADESIELALFLITNEELTNEVKNKRFAGVDVRGIIDNTTTDEYDFLLSQNVNVVPHAPETLLHHKYAVVDATALSSDPTVITGSHNWTYYAETINDENTLIFHNGDIANLFLQEFEERWNEVGPVSIYQATNELNDILISPNPFTNNLKVSFNVEKEDSVIISLVNSLGQEVYSTDSELITGKNTIALNVNELLKGFYFLTIKNDNGSLLYSQNLVKL